MPTLDPALARRLVRWNQAMFAFHTVFVVVTAATADLGMRLPLLRPEIGAPDVDAEMGSGADDGFRNWVSYRTLVPDSYTLPIAWVALAFSALSAGFHFANAFVWRAFYLGGIADARCAPRWIEYSVSAPLQMMAIAFLSGCTTTEVQVALFGLVSVTMFFGHLTEVVARPRGDAWSVGVAERLTPHFLGYVPFLFAVAIVLQVFARAAAFEFTDPVTHEVRRMPTFVYAIVATQLVLFSSFTVVQLVVTLRPPKDYAYGELAYMTLSLVAKGVLSLLLLANVIALEAFGAA